MRKSASSKIFCGHLVQAFFVCVGFWLACVSHLANAQDSGEEFTAGKPARTVPNAEKPRAEQYEKPVLIQFEGEINTELTAFFNQKFLQATEEGADLIILEVNSPGGLKTQSLEIGRTLRDCKSAYTVAVIDKEAMSGAALVSLGCDEIQVDRNAKFGVSGAIFFDYEEMAFRHAPEKIVSALAGDARALAESKGRPADLAEAMVDRDALVFIRPSKASEAGTFQFQVVRAGDDEPGKPWMMVHESRPGRFLGVSGQRAVELGLADGHNSRLDKLAKDLNFDPEKLTTFRPGFSDRLAYQLNRPLWAGFLIFVGLIALYIELSAPGLGVGGLMAALCAGLFFWSKFASGTGGWLEVILFVAGVVFILMEIFVIPGFGVAGISGMILLLTSVILASQNFVFPQTATETNRLVNNLFMLVVTGFLSFVGAMILSRYLGSMPVFKQFVLSPPPVLADTGSEATGDELAERALEVGELGVADSLLRPAGRGNFRGRAFDVISEGEFIEAGTPIIVVDVRGNVIRVAVQEFEEV